MGGKGSPAPAPDYTPYAQASVEAAKIQSQSSADQLAWAKEQYADMAPLTKQYLGDMIASSELQYRNAVNDRTRYEQEYQPIEDAFNRKAMSWNSADRAEQQAGAAMGAVSQQFEQARSQNLAQLESFGIDPSQTRYGALDLGTRVSQAATQASAGTQSRLNTEATSLALQGEAINIGKGYPGQIAQSWSGATQAGSAGISAGNQTASTFGNLMGTATQWGALSNNSMGGALDAAKAKGNYELSATGLRNQAAGDTARGIGSLIGAGVSIAALS